MLRLEALDERCLPSFIAVPGFPGSTSGWSQTPGRGAVVHVYFQNLSGPTLSATRAALASLDQQFRQAAVDVRFVPVKDRSLADVTVGSAALASSEGGVTNFCPLRADGHLGGRVYFRWHGRIKIVMAAHSPWYFGAAPAVPPGELDYESAVMHELGHSLSLGHDNSRNDVANQDGFDTMNAVLPRGVARRHFSNTDLADLREVYGSTR